MLLSILNSTVPSLSDMSPASASLDDIVEVVMDDIVSILSELLESAGLLPSSAQNDSEKDPWIVLSDSLQELVGLLSKTSQLLSAQQQGNIHNDNDYFQEDELDELLLNVEEITCRVRDEVETLSKWLSKYVPIQLERCRRLGACCIHTNQVFPKQLWTLSKALEDAIRQQNETLFHSLHTIRQNLSQISDPDTVDATISTLRLESQLIRGRCLSRSSLPWNRALKVLTHCASFTIDEHENDIERITNQPQDLAMWIENEALSDSPDESSTLLSSAGSFMDFVNQIVSKSHSPAPEKHTWSLLLVGPEGSGKTTKLDDIAMKARASGFDVLRPSLPFDAMGTTVGAAEDALVAMVSCVSISQRDCILLLDDVDSVCGEMQEISGESSASGVGGFREAHVTARVRSVLLALLDSINKQRSSSVFPTAKTIIVCTSKTNFGKYIDRFDEVFKLGLPEEKEREAIISSYLTNDLAPSLDLESISLKTIVEATSGLSLSELTQLCQQSMIAQKLQFQDDAVEIPTILEILKMKLQSSTPESLKSGASEDFVDMKVFTSRDLQQMFPIRDRSYPLQDLPLFGEMASNAWQELRRLIVLPVCQGDALDRIMFHNQNGIGSSRKAFAGGVLMASPPGTGKSTLAYFCAAFASLMNPSVKLIDVSCTSLVHKEVGGSERALHRLFQIARRSTPCILVMDGIENIAAVRGNDNTTEGTMDRLLSTLLTELDGVDSQYVSQSQSSPSFAIIGITHNHRWIDPALRRPGRLERIIKMANPEIEARAQIVSKEMRGVEVRPDDQIPDIQSLSDLAGFVASKTAGFSGAGVVAVCNEAKLLASKALLENPEALDDPRITPSLFVQAIESQRTSLDDTDDVEKKRRSQKQRQRGKNPDRKRHGARNQDRHKIFVKWLLEKFDLVNSHFADEDSPVKPPQHILDVAGGRGEVSARLTMCHRQRVVMVDPRPANVVDCFESLVLPKIPNKWQQKLEHQRSDNPDFVKDVVGARFEQLVTTFDDASLSSSVELQEMIQNASLLLGLHADGATEAIVGAALKYNKPFVVVPCCVFPNFFTSRTIVEGDQQVPVRSHQQFCRYLVEKDSRFVMEEVPFAGRNIAIRWDGN